MAKEVEDQIKMQIKGGQANPGPPIGPALGQHGLDIQEFCERFNEKTSDRQGELVPIIITVYADRTFEIETKEPPASALIKQKAGIESGAQNPLTETVAELSDQDLEEIADKKMPDLNAYDIEQAKKIIAGTAKQMGVKTPYSE
ncbi:MAG: 50S ribosomal protein L11 [Parcubacteria group bacterium QH_9_35_7]|nr:MAG: 50S ribosomal protein L11 [Parcubacteria group bacterium QH_9_35_7]